MQPLRSKGIKILERIIEISKACGISEIYDGYSDDFSSTRQALRDGSLGTKAENDLFYLNRPETTLASEMQAVVDDVLDAVKDTVNSAEIRGLLYTGCGIDEFLWDWIDRLNDHVGGHTHTGVSVLAVYLAVEEVARYFHVEMPSVQICGDIPRKYEKEGPWGLYAVSFGMPFQGLNEV